MPSADAKQTIFAATKDITQALLQTDSTTLLPPKGTNTGNSLQQLSEIFRNRLTSSALIPPYEPTEVPRVPETSVPTKVSRVLV